MSRLALLALAAALVGVAWADERCLRLLRPNGQNIVLKFDNNDWETGDVRGPLGAARHVEIDQVCAFPQDVRQAIANKGLKDDFPEDTYLWVGQGDQWISIAEDDNSNPSADQLAKQVTWRFNTAARNFAFGLGVPDASVNSGSFEGLQIESADCAECAQHRAVGAAGAAATQDDDDSVDDDDLEGAEGERTREEALRAAVIGLAVFLVLFILLFLWALAWAMREKSKRDRLEDRYARQPYYSASYGRRSRGMARRRASPSAYAAPAASQQAGYVGSPSYSGPAAYKM